MTSFNPVVYCYDLSCLGFFIGMLTKEVCVCVPAPVIITMTSSRGRLRLKSPASRLFTQPFIQAQNKENIKAPRHWPLCGEFTGDR